MSLITAAIAATVGWLTLAGTFVWYWRTVVPDFYEGDSALPFALVMAAGAVAHLAVLIGAMRRTMNRPDGMAVMVGGSFVLIALIFSTLATTGVLLIPGFVVATLAAALPPTRPWVKARPG